MYGVIYKITNLINQKIYIGYTTRSLERRFNCHIVDSKNPKYPIQRAIKKYGKANFAIEVIDFADSFEELCQKEILWIGRLDSMNPKVGYNLTKGGGGQLGRVQSTEEKAKRVKNRQQRIKCIETNEVFESIVSATKKFGFSNGHIRQHLKGSISSVKGFTFEYLDKKNIVKKERKIVFCVTTNEIFKTVSEAAKKYNISRSNITNVLSGRTKKTKELEFKYL
jgi:group I intron endonuclease